MEILKWDEIITMYSLTKAWVKIILSSLRIPLLDLYPHKINIMSFLWGSMSKYQRNYNF